MNIKTIIRSVALIAVIGGAAPAFAASTTAVAPAAKLSSSDIASVQERCDQLQDFASTPVSLADLNAEPYSTNDLDGSYRVNALAQATTGVNLNGISLEDCEAYGAVVGS